MKLWSGMYKEDTDELMDLFNSSVDIDSKLFEEDIQGSIAHCKMLLKVGLLKEDEFIKINEGLLEILKEISDGKIEFSIHDEDVHMSIEKLLIQKIGDTGKKLHTARSRNDQVTLDLKLYVKKEIKKINILIKELMKVIVDISSDKTEVIMPGYTHLQRAQPIRLSFYLMAYFYMLKRDYKRFETALSEMDTLPLGSGALSGTGYETDREYLKDILNFTSVSENAMDAVSDRDYVIVTSSNIAIGIMHLSRLAEEIVIYNSKEFDFIKISDKFSTGSSMMPQKKNPDAAELIRGKSGSIYGNLISLLVMMKGLPLAYNKDMQEDKKQIFDAIDNYKISLKVMAKMLETMKFNDEKMLEATKKGYLNATDLAEYLVKKGVAFRDSHEIVGKMVSYAIEKDITLEEMSLEDFKLFSKVISEDVYKTLDIVNCVESKKSQGSTNLNSVLDMILNAKKWLEVTN